MRATRASGWGLFEKDHQCGTPLADATPPPDRCFATATLPTRFAGGISGHAALAAPGDAFRTHSAKMLGAAGIIDCARGRAGE